MSTLAVSDVPEAHADAAAILSAPAPRMRAAVMTGPHDVAVQLIERPAPGPQEMRIRVQGCGVCASNLGPWESLPGITYPLEAGAPGHEGWGSIDALGPGVTGWQTGERVAFLGGRSYAEYDVVASSAAVRLPPMLDGRPFPGEAIACAVNVFRRSRIAPGDDVAVVGIGFLGALLVQLAVRAGANVVALSRRDFALDLADRMGALETLAMDDHARVLQAARGLTSGRGFARVVEATGKQWPLDLASELTAEGGTLVIAGYHQDGPRRVNMQLWNWRGLDVINAHERDPRVQMAGLQRAVHLAATGELEFLPLITDRLPLERLGDALDRTSRRPDGFLKAVVMP
jgi:threonine dehydrogenase-like Zn-dependent dehydrogenase